MQTNESLISFSAELKSAREAKDISLEEISGKTRINMKFLKAIETAEFEVLPDVYLKAFLKEYAKSVDLDPNKVIQKYDLAKIGKYSNEDEEVQLKEEAAPSEEPLPRRKFGASTNAGPIMPEIEEMRSGSSRNYLPIFVIIAIIIFILSLIYIFFIKDHSSEIVKDNSAGESFYEDIFEVDDAVSVITSATDSIILRIETDADAWYRAIIDDRNAAEFNLKSGNSRTIKAREKVKLVLGNSGATKLFLNGKGLDFTGIEDQVKRLEITASGIKKITEKELSANE